MYWGVAKVTDFRHLSIKQMTDLMRDLHLIDQGRLRTVWDDKKGAFVWRHWRYPKGLRPDELRCNAKCRDGHACQWKVARRGERCKLHGGLSTGPKTEEGRERIRESNRRRAALRRAEKEKANA